MLSALKTGFFLFLLTIISSCETYEYGPTISLTSTKKRLERHEWKLKLFEKNSSDYTSVYKTCTIKFKGSQVYLNFDDPTSTVYSIKDTAEYNLEEDNYRINIKGDFSNSMYIKRLDHKHFWFFFTIKNSDMYYQMVPQ